MMFDVSVTGIIHCINWAIAKGDLQLAGGREWILKRSETELEKNQDPKFVLVGDGGTTVHPCPDIIEMAIRAGCLEDRGKDNAKYQLVP